MPSFPARSLIILNCGDFSKVFIMEGGKPTQVDRYIISIAPESGYCSIDMVDVPAGFTTDGSSNSFSALLISVSVSITVLTRTKIRLYLVCLQLFLHCLEFLPEAVQLGFLVRINLPHLLIPFKDADFIPHCH